MAEEVQNLLPCHHTPRRSGQFLGQELACYHERNAGECSFAWA
eukprot:CAMPEP_0204060598 /NCGR_PEP_ID=MMETSP0360-20130528/140273_1 /ASSEMBLY_ACC=CAM_ASM_000342 /TAXON_ID=268821 /ORGANISM="Scrippsiella Hangoei, Strain SHTV-5" /LENGTH=42 /DNA_ID= /DNA_START= /DNA_END= /DNA_ORIENTATION=